MARKVVQISGVDNDGEMVRALCDDGTMWEANWRSGDGKEIKAHWEWTQIQCVPDTAEEKPNSNQHTEPAIALFAVEKWLGSTHAPQLVTAIIAEMREIEQQQAGR